MWPDRAPPLLLRRWAGLARGRSGQFGGATISAAHLQAALPVPVEVALDAAGVPLLHNLVCGVRAGMRRGEAKRCEAAAHSIAELAGQLDKLAAAGSCTAGLLRPAAAAEVLAAQTALAKPLQAALRNVTHTRTRRRGSSASGWASSATSCRGAAVGAGSGRRVGHEMVVGL